MEEPPFLLDAARVLEYAGLDLARTPDSFSAVVAGISLGRHNVSRLAIVETLLDGAVFLLHCNERWETLAAESFRDPARARLSATGLYGPALGAWTPFRALTAEETREAATTADFLRGLAADATDLPRAG